MLGLRKRQISEGDDYRWLLRAVVTRSGRPTMVGRVGFHGPPDADGVVEIGYRIDSTVSRRGYGFECAARLIEAAERLQAVSAVRASIAPDNEPSLRIAKRLGFRLIGEQIDEIDGLELVFERKAEAAPGRAIPGTPSSNRPSSRSGRSELGRPASGVTLPVCAAHFLLEYPWPAARSSDSRPSPRAMGHRS